MRQFILDSVVLGSFALVVILLVALLVITLKEKGLAKTIRVAVKSTCELVLMFSSMIIISFVLGVVFVAIGKLVVMVTH